MPIASPLALCIVVYNILNYYTTMFKYYLGIDQTGAVNQRGIPKPLPATLLWEDQGKVFVIPRLKLADLNYASIHAVFTDANITLKKNEKVLICVDSVLGLPVAVNTPIRKIFKDIIGFSFQNKEYGSITAYHFFQRYLSTSNLKKNPIREIEGKLGANSVFNLMPFQKNIGCGTYRILRNLAEDVHAGNNWFHIWPQENIQGQFTLCEGYPSYFWKTTLGQPRRDLGALKKMKLGFKTLDEADSFVLAYGCYKNKDFIKNFKFRNNDKLKLEGWIYGAPVE